MNQEIFSKELIECIKNNKKSKVHEELKNANYGEIAIIIYLYNKQGITAGDLAFNLKVGSGRCANALNALEKKEYITRIKDQNDKRKTIVELTTLGRQKAFKCIEMRKRYIALLYEILGEEDAINLLRIMKKITKAKEELNA